jgi:dTDP-4-amino-4,6-dideoxygalactose transaminase
VFGGRRPDLPMTDLYERTNISIPLHQGMTDSDVGRVIQAIQGGW